MALCLSSLTLRALTLMAVCMLATESSYRTSFTERLVATLLGACDWIAVSAYVLLLAVYVHLHYEARQHLFSDRSMRTAWLVVLSLSNAAIVCLACGLYVAVFVTNADPEGQLFRGTYLSIAVVNIVFPGGCATTWLAASLLFAGFPYRSQQLRAQATIVQRLLIVWTAARIAWAALSFVFASSAMVDAVSGVGTWLFELLLGTVFVLADMLPSLMALLVPSVAAVLLRGRPDAKPELDAEAGQGGGSPLDTEEFATARAPDSGHFGDSPRLSLNDSEVEFSRGVSGSQLAQSLLHRPEQSGSSLARMGSSPGGLEARTPSRHHSIPELF